MNTPEGTQPTTLQPMSYEQAEQRLQNMGQRIRNVEQECKRAIEDAADAESIYRKALADRFAELRKEGLAVEAAHVQARGELWKLSNERDRAAGMVRLRMEQLEDRRGERHSLHKLVDWSGGLQMLKTGGDGFGNG